jgi:ribosomal protein S18 acetylase RimI-like enzyme
MIFIRNANKNDISMIAKFNSSMAMETKGKEMNAEIVILGVETAQNDNNRGFYLIAENDGTPFGQLMITKEWSDWSNGEFWWIQSVYVHSDFRSKGIYKHLYNEVNRLAKSANKVCGIRLYVEKENINAQKVYSKLGLEKTNYLLFENDWSNE